MRLKPEESKKLAVHVTELLMKDPQVTVKVSRAKVLEAIEGTLRLHFEQERQIETKADAIFQDQAESLGRMERGKALSIIKQKLADEQKFVLSGGAQGARFSQDKINFLSHVVGDKLYDDDLMDFRDEDEGPKYLKRVFANYFQQEDQLVDRVKKKVQSLANAPFEGSREWDVLFKKYWEEEMKRMGHGG